MQRTRLLILVALLVVVIGIVAAFLLVGSDDPADPAPAPTQPAGQQPVDSDATAAPDADEPTFTPLPTQELTTIIIAIQPISRGQEIVEGTIGFRAWPVDALPFNAFEAETTELEDLFGQIARTDIQAEQPLLTSYLTPSRQDLAAIGSDLAAIIPEGDVAIAVPVDLLTSVAFGIQPGDRVDVSVSLLYVDIDAEFQSILPNTASIVFFNEDGIPQTGPAIEGRFEQEAIPGRAEPLVVIESPVEPPRPRLVVQRTVQDAQILYVGELPPDGRIFGTTPTPAPVLEDEEGADAEPTPVGTPPISQRTINRSIVVVAVTPQEALVMTWLIEAGVPLNFLLRSAADNSRVLTDAVTLGYIMDSYEIALPPPRDFSIEPAIREIRRITLPNLQAISSGGAEVPAP